MKNRKTLVKIIAVLLPILFLVLVELFLQVFNLFPQTPLFLNKSKDGKAVIEINSRIGERYFNKKNVPVPNLYPQTFSEIKKKDTFRIFCLGGSTTAGFPYEMTVPFPQQLYFLLKNDYPEKEFEVVNMGLSAINSFTVYDWLPDILQHEPDLIIIYMGHNEFYGAYGTGSTISFGNNASFVRLALTLRKLHLAQMLNALIQYFIPASSSGPSPTLMEKIIDEKFIAANSELREVTHENFSKNLDLILAACVKDKTPVIISNLVSNLKDQAPLDISTLQITDSIMAVHFYKKGLGEYKVGDSVSAYISFSAARDRDAIPFRAHSEINSIIYNKVQEYRINFVDMNEAFRALSPRGIPGKNIFCDHLHPNPTGYRIMANEFRRAISKTNLLPPLNQTNKYITTPLMVTGLDWEIGSIRIFKLKHSWPFEIKTVNYAAYPPYENEVSAQIAKNFLFDHHSWGRAHSEMADYYVKSGALNKACAEYRVIVEMFPGKIEYYIKLIDCAKTINAWQIVESTCLKALNFSKFKGIFYYNLALSERMTGNIEKALKNIQKAIDAPELNREQLAQYFYTYATFLLDARQLPAAKQLLQKLVKNAPDFKPAKELLKQLPN